MKTLKITEELHKRIKVFCVERDLKMNQWVEEHLLEILNQEKIKNNNDINQRS